MTEGNHLLCCFNRYFLYKALSLSFYSVFYKHSVLGSKSNFFPIYKKSFTVTKRRRSPITFSLSYKTTHVIIFFPQACNNFSLCFIASESSKNRFFLFACYLRIIVEPCFTQQENHDNNQR